MWLIRILSAVRNPWLAVRAGLKRRAFRRAARTGPGLQVGPYAEITNPSRDRGCIEIGEHVSILGGLHVQGEGCIRIGDYSTIRARSVVQAVERVEIGAHVMISQEVVIQDNNNHPTSPRERHELVHSGFAPELNLWARSESAPVVIEDDVWIGMRAVVLKGVRIGRGAIVGAAAVVTKEVPPFCVAVGNPARVVNELANDLDGDAGGGGADAG